MPAIPRVNNTYLVNLKKLPSQHPDYFSSLTNEVDHIGNVLINEKQRST